MRDLSTTEIACLRWMVAVNNDGIGLFWQTVARHGPMLELRSLAEDGLCTLKGKAWTARRDDPAAGYWVTPAGRAALSAIEEGGHDTVTSDA